MTYEFKQEILDSLPPLVAGSHSDENEAVCAMEALARACGLGTTDEPKCASVIIAAFTRTLNDAMPNPETRDRYIRPLLPLMVGTAYDGHDETRMWMLVDAAVRVFAADAIHNAGLVDAAKTLRELEPINNAGSANVAGLSAKVAAELAYRAAEFTAAATANDAVQSAQEAVRSVRWDAESMALSQSELAELSATSAAISTSKAWAKAANVLRAICVVN